MLKTELRPMALHHEGAALEGEIALPERPGPHPAIMVMHDARGLRDLVRERVRRLAAMGYAALATDMYGADMRQADEKQAGAMMVALQGAPEKFRSRVVAWHEALKARPEVDANRIAAIGYCFGGQCVLELARSGADVKAVVSFHGLLTTALPAQPDAVKAQVAIYTGAKDPYAPPEHVEAIRRELSAARACWHITIFGEAHHAFTDPGAEMLNRPGIKYDPLASRVSWAGAVALLKATIG